MFDQEAETLSPIAAGNLEKTSQSCPHVNTLIFVAEHEAPGLVEQSQEYAKVKKGSSEKHAAIGLTCICVSC